MELQLEQCRRAADAEALGRVIKMERGLSAGASSRILAMGGGPGEVGRGVQGGGSRPQSEETRGLGVPGVGSR